MQWLEAVTTKGFIRTGGGKRLSAETWQQSRVLVVGRRQAAPFGGDAHCANVQSNSARLRGRGEETRLIGVAVGDGESQVTSGGDSVCGKFAKWTERLRWRGASFRGRCKKRVFSEDQSCVGVQGGIRKTPKAGGPARPHDALQGGLERI